MIPSQTTLLDQFPRFWAKAEIGSPKECWLWQAGKSSHGYGKYYGNSTTYYAHRLAYESVKGEIPDGLVIDHLCCTPACVNPNHLEVVTHGENSLRGTSPPAVNARKTNCINGHEFSEDNTYMDTANKRVCIICKRAKQRRGYWRRKKALAAFLEDEHDTDRTLQEVLAQPLGEMEISIIKYVETDFEERQLLAIARAAGIAVVKAFKAKVEVLCADYGGDDMPKVAGYVFADISEFLDEAITAAVGGD